MRYLPVAFRTPLFLTSEQTLKDLKRSQGHQRGGEESGFGYNWALRTSPNLNIMKYKGTYLFYNYVHLIRTDDFLFTYCIYGHIFRNVN